MPEVSIKIGPKTYNVGCGEGEQEQVAQLGQIIAEKYGQLGDARAPTESQNLLFTSIFMADELRELRARVTDAEKSLSSMAEEMQARHTAELKETQEDLKTAEKAAKKAEDALAKAQEDASKELEKASKKAEEEIAKAREEVEREKAKTEKKSELKAEIAALRKAEEQSREEVERLKAEIVDLREAASKQDDMFGDESSEEKIAQTLEKLAERTEAVAEAMEDASRSMLEDDDSKD